MQYKQAMETITFRLTDSEKRGFIQACKNLNRTQSGVLREFIRSFNTENSFDSGTVIDSVDCLDSFDYKDLPSQQYEGTATLLPSISGVYFFITSGGDLAYIGQTTSIRRRLKHHERIDQFLSLDCKVCWVEVVPDLLLEVESRLIFELKPMLNQTLIESPGDRADVLSLFHDIGFDVDKWAEENSKKIVDNFKNICSQIH